VNPANLSPGRYTGSVTVTAAGAVNSPQIISVMLLVNAAPVSPGVTAVVNGASFVGGGIVPGEIATIFGSNLTSITGTNLTPSLPLPTAFLNVSVIVDGSPVPLFAVDDVGGQQQINFQIPWRVASESTAIIAVTNNGSTSPAIPVPVLIAQPGIFGYSVGGQVFGAVLHANFQLADIAHPVEADETVLIYCTGLGAVSSPPADGVPANGQPTTVTPTVTIGGAPATVSFSGLAPGFVGLNQVNVRVPSGLKSGNQALVMTIGGASSDSVLLPVT
jgi:adhesin/invasin